MPPRFSLAKRKAKELLLKAEIKRVPVPVERLPSLVGAVVRYEPFDGRLSGMVHRSSTGKTIIGVNSSHPNTRQRFTIAHELGHILLHKDERFHVDQTASIRFRDEESSLATNTEEIESNQFAAELLMPENLVRKEITRLAGSLDPEDAIPVLAARFEVSEQAMTLRLTKLRFLV